jgi:tetratricopeptide (TPR) repeat protein
MMVEGNVNVNNLANVENLLKLADNAAEASNQKEAEDYANRVLELSADNYKAWLIKGNAAGWQSTIKNNRFAESVECFGKAIDNVPDAEKEAVQKKIASDMAKLSCAMLSLCCDNFSDCPSEHTAKTITENATSSKILALALLRKCGVKPESYEEQMASLMHSSAVSAWTKKVLPAYRGDDDKPDKYRWDRFKEQVFACLSVIRCAIGFSYKDDASDIQRYKDMIFLTQTLVDSCSWRAYYSNGTKYYAVEYTLTDEAKQSNIDNIMKYHEKIKKLDPNYVIPERPTPKEHKSGGCYIATAVYGSYDCPEVWTLRRYRDNKLSCTWYGTAFIKLYYAVSPTLVCAFGGSKMFTKFCRRYLDPIVCKLQLNGYSSLPYSDDRQ